MSLRFRIFIFGGHPLGPSPSRNEDVSDLDVWDAMQRGPLRLVLERRCLRVVIRRLAGNRTHSSLSLSHPPLTSHPHPHPHPRSRSHSHICAVVMVSWTVKATSYCEFDRCRQSAGDGLCTALSCARASCVCVCSRVRETWNSAAPKQYADCTRRGQRSPTLLRVTRYATRVSVLNVHSLCRLARASTRDPLNATRDRL